MWPCPSQAVTGRIDIPNVRPDSVTLTVEGGMLTMSLEATERDDGTGDVTWYSSSWHVPGGVDASKVQ